MRLVEQARNFVESNRTIGFYYDFLGKISIYKKYVFYNVQKRIDYIQKNRCYGIMIETSSICNAKCVFCPNHSLQRPRTIMSDHLFDMILLRIEEDKINPPIIDLFDIGEPLIDKAIFTRIKNIKARFPLTEVRITTNLNLATDEILDQIIDSGLDSIHISLNAATPQTYKKIMGLKYDQTKNNLDKLLEKRKSSGSNLYILLSMVICEDNLNEEKMFMEGWASKVDCVRLQRAIDWGGRMDIKSPYSSNKFLYPCNDLFERIVILSNGDVALCCQDAEGMIHKNIANHSILEIFSSERFERLRRKHLNAEIAGISFCKNCFGTNSNGANWIFKKNK